MDPNPYEPPQGPSQADPPLRSTWPLIVRVGLWGVPSRRAAWGYFWFSNLTAFASVLCGFFYPICYLGVFLVFSGLWYYLTIRWVDRNSRWE